MPKVSKVIKIEHQNKRVSLGTYIHFYRYLFKYGTKGLNLCAGLLVRKKIQEFRHRSGGLTVLPKRVIYRLLVFGAASVDAEWCGAPEQDDSMTSSSK